MVYPSISVIILNWNGLADTIECLESLRQITNPKYSVIVVDNGSSGDDAQALKQKFGDYIFLIENDKNYGFAGGMNTGIEYSLKHFQPDYILSLNNDTTVEPQFLDRLVEAVKDDNTIGIAGSKVYYYDDPTRILSLGMMILMKIGMTYSIGKGTIDSNVISRNDDVDYVDTCFLIKADVIQKIGLFDESFFCYLEDADYCIRAKKSGYRVCCVPTSKIWHKKALKKKTVDRISEGMRVSASAQYYVARNSFRFMRKHATKFQYLSFLTFLFGCYFWLMLAALILFYRDKKRFVSFCNGIKDGLFNKSGARF
jgi:GT2 family glycosyltransferase